MAVDGVFGPMDPLTKSDVSSVFLQHHLSQKHHQETVYMY
jgi:hypothetical protein